MMIDKRITGNNPAAVSPMRSRQIGGADVDKSAGVVQSGERECALHRDKVDIRSGNPASKTDFAAAVKAMKQEIIGDLTKQNNIDKREAVKASIQNGTYQIDAGSIAEKLIEEFKMDWLV